MTATCGAGERRPLGVPPHEVGAGGRERTALGVAVPLRQLGEHVFPRLRSDADLHPD